MNENGCEVHRTYTGVGKPQRRNGNPSCKDCVTIWKARQRELERQAKATTAAAKARGEKTGNV